MLDLTEISKSSMSVGNDTDWQKVLPDPESR